MEDSKDLLDNTASGNYVYTPPARPAFLTVLCILTFVGSGFGLISALFGLMFSGMNDASFQMMERSMENNPFADSFGFNFEEMARWTAYSQWANLVGSALCLTGALMMWKLKKIGFFLYIPGWIIPVTISAIAMQYIMSGSGVFSNFGSLGIVVNVIFAAAFIIMYGVNYKHLK